MSIVLFSFALCYISYYEAFVTHPSPAHTQTHTRICTCTLSSEKYTNFSSLALLLNVAFA